MNKRINVILPEQTLTVLDRIAKKGDRSRIISEAVLHYVHNRAKQRLKEQLKAGYQANAQENIEIAMEWFPLEEEALNESRRRSVRGKK
jgi:CopG family transcriptional regulator/antitoxin EndoAI